MEQMMVNLLPVFLILAIGFLARRSGFLNASAMDGLKSVLIRVGLPSALFLAFCQADLNPGYIWVFLAVFGFCVFLYLLGGALHRWLPRVFPDAYTNAYFTGFEFGMIGIGLFTAIWGMEKLPTIAMIALGHEIFIWFVYVPVLESRKTGRVDVWKIVRDFFRTPTVMAILLGVLFNVFGIYIYLSSVMAGQAVLKSLTMTSNLVAPLILLVIGYSLSFKRVPLRKSIALIATRWAAVLGFGYLLLQVLQRFLVLDGFFRVAFVAFILLPPPFILPLFMKPEHREEISFFSELLIYYTVVSFFAYMVFMSMGL